MADYRRQLGVGAVFALVLLRLAIGWHFFREGIGKLAYDDGQRQYKIAFSAEGFLTQAKGPLADQFHAWAPNVHDWPALLARPKENLPLTDEDAEKQADWLAGYNRRKAAAEKENKPVPVECSPSSSYHLWVMHIVDDWQQILSSFCALTGLSEEQRHLASDIFVAREQQLADYLAEQSDAIADYQHELWRLEQWRAAPEVDVPFMQKRIAAKAAETAAIAAPWVKQVHELDEKLIDDLRQLLTPEQKAQAITSQALAGALVPEEEKRLQRLNVGVTILTIGVGVCLLLGFFTRLASFTGALFLLTVIATQPPWVAEAAPTYNQIVECAALLVLAGTRAGRWFGLDYITYSLFHRRRDVDD